MQITFYKYHGAGNDFIIIDNRESLFKVQNDIVEHLCRRRFGIGADGLMLLENSDKGAFSMRYFNSDGKESTMCGNGGRCIVSFAHFLGLVRNETEFMAYDGLHKAIVLNPDMIALQMKDVDGYKMFGSDYFMDTGSPQYVTFVENLRNTPVYEKGQQIRYDPLISQNGTNVNFVYKESLNQISVRTYERGVENETLACGTGSIASAISAYLKFQPDKSSFIVNVLGGKLKVDFIPADNNSFRDIWLTGPANFVYQGTVPVE